MINKLAIITVASVLYLAGTIQAAPYALNTTGLSAIASINTSTASNTVDGNYTVGTGWYSGAAGNRLLISFNDGPQFIDKIEFFQSSNGIYSVFREFQLYYTTAPNPTLSSTLYEMTGIELLTVPGSIDGNTISTSTRINDFRLGFDDVLATGIVYHHIRSSWGSGADAMINEVSVDISTAIPVPEPASMILLGLGVVGLIRQRIKKLH